MATPGKRVPLFSDPWRKFRRVAIRLLALYLIIIVWNSLIQPLYYMFRAQAIVRKFEKSKSEDLVDDLVYLVDNRLVSSTLGSRILADLTTPIIHKRKTYSEGWPPIIELEWPYAIRGRNFGYRAEYEITQSRSGFGIKHLWYPESETVYLDITKSGAYSPMCRIATNMNPNSDREWHDYLEIPYCADLLATTSCYRFSSTVACNINISSTNSEYAIETVHEKALDERMHASINAAFGPELFAVQYPEYTLETYNPTVSLKLVDLPVAVAWRIIIQFENGAECQYENGELAGFLHRSAPAASGTFTMHPSLDLCGQSTDRDEIYRGVLHLVPDKSLAWSDPAIATIWDGTITVPFEFKIPEQREVPVSSSKNEESEVIIMEQP